jgi:hypothetical protein
MPSPGNKSPSSALSSTVWFLKRPNFIEGIAAFPPMEKVEVRKCWRRERNWVRTFSAQTNADESNPAYAPVQGISPFKMLVAAPAPSVTRGRTGSVNPSPLTYRSGEDTLPWRTRCLAPFWNAAVPTVQTGHAPASSTAGANSMKKRAEGDFTGILVQSACRNVASSVQARSH